MSMGVSPDGAGLSPDGRAPTGLDGSATSIHDAASADFESILAVERQTPTGGVIKFGVGYLMFQDGGQDQAVAIQVHDDHQRLVTQFALRMPSFAVLLEGMMDVFHAAQGMSAGTAETAQQAQGEARQPGPKDAPGEPS